MLHPDRLFPSEPGERNIARELYGSISELPLICPHGHTDPAWFASNEPFPDPTALLVTPDHYLVRMLVSRGVPIEALGVRPRVGRPGPEFREGREAWRVFAAHYHLFRATPSRLWLDHALHEVLEVPEPLSAETADRAYDHIAERLADAAYRPRALYERFGIEVLATTDGALDDLGHHRAMREEGWGAVVPTFRPDAVIDPDFEGFAANLARLGKLTGEDVEEWDGYLAALGARRAFFREHGATATDHGHPSAATADLPGDQAAALYARVRSGEASADERETFRAQMLTELARMSLGDGLVMQLHAGADRNYHRGMHARYGRDIGFDVPAPASFREGLRPLLNAHGMDERLTLILFTLDETTYGRELAPLAGVFPSLLLGPPWWFFDSVEGMETHRRQTIETAGFANTAGFNDDTRAFLSIPARHDVARRMDCRFLARLVAEHRLGMEDARELAKDLAYTLAKRAYRFGDDT